MNQPLQKRKIDSANYVLMIKLIFVRFMPPYDSCSLMNCGVSELLTAGI